MTPEEAQAVWMAVKHVEAAAWARRWGALKAARALLEEATGMKRPYPGALDAVVGCGEREEGR